MKPMRKSPKAVSPDQVTILLRRYNKIVAASRQMLNMMERMKEEGALRLPFPGHEEALEELRKAMP